MGDVSTYRAVFNHNSGYMKRFKELYLDRPGIFYHENVYLA